MPRRQKRIQASQPTAGVASNNRPMKRRRSRRVMKRTYGDNFVGKSFDTGTLTSLQNIQKLNIQIVHYIQDKPNQYLEDIPEMVWNHHIIPFLSLKALAQSREISSFFESYWKILFYKNEIPLRVPLDVSFNNLSDVCYDLRQLQWYGKDYPLVVMLSEGVHHVKVNFRDNDEEINYVPLSQSITLVGAGKDKTFIQGGLMVRGTHNDHVLIQHLTVQNSKRSGIRGYDGASFEVEDVVVENCGTCGIVAWSTHGLCKNVEIRQCGWSAVVASEKAKIILDGPRTTIHNNCTAATDGSYYGLSTWMNSSIDIVYPLTKEIASVKNGGGGNWGGEGTVTNVVANGLPWGRLVALRDWEGSKMGDEYALSNSDEAAVGRKSSSDVKISDSTVSGLHCTLRPKFHNNNCTEMYSCEITDKSSNGTWLNGIQLEKDEPQTCRFGDIISLCQSHDDYDGEHVASFQFIKGGCHVKWNSLQRNIYGQNGGVSNRAPTRRSLNSSFNSSSNSSGSSTCKSGSSIK